MRNPHPHRGGLGQAVPGDVGIGQEGTGAGVGKADVVAVSLGAAEVEVGGGQVKAQKVIEGLLAAGIVDDDRAAPGEIGAGQGDGCGGASALDGGVVMRVGGEVAVGGLAPRREGGQLVGHGDRLDPRAAGAGVAGKQRPVLEPALAVRQRVDGRSRLAVEFGGAAGAAPGGNAQFRLGGGRADLELHAAAGRNRGRPVERQVVGNAVGVVGRRGVGTLGGIEGRRGCGLRGDGDRRRPGGVLPPLEQRLDLRRRERAVVDAHIVHRPVKTLVAAGEVATDRHPLGAGDEIQVHGDGVGVLDTVDVEGEQRPVVGDGDMVPAAGLHRGGRVPAAGVGGAEPVGGEAQRAVAPYLQGVRAGLDAAGHQPFPVAEGVRVDPRRQRQLGQVEIGTVGDDEVVVGAVEAQVRALGEADVGVARPLAAVRALPGRPVDQRAGVPKPAAVGGASTGAFVQGVAGNQPVGRRRLVKHAVKAGRARGLRAAVAQEDGLGRRRRDRRHPHPHRSLLRGGVPGFDPVTQHRGPVRVKETDVVAVRLRAREVEVGGVQLDAHLVVGEGIAGVVVKGDLPAPGEFVLRQFERGRLAGAADGDPDERAGAEVGVAGLGPDRVVGGGMRDVAGRQRGVGRQPVEKAVELGAGVVQIAQAGNLRADGLRTARLGHRLRPGRRAQVAADVGKALPRQ
ncbi:MAG: hypothetical protein BWZ02_00873 [Lentisphaerae bacterium ADurb.BinA184]|nr:MAG: hypothetical protein BWZ02_00873 [Lentisphaerae bacterium ADurb.BinA184]